MVFWNFFSKKGFILVPIGPVIEVQTPCTAQRQEWGPLKFIIILLFDLIETERSTYTHSINAIYVKLVQNIYGLGTPYLWMGSS